MSFKKSHILNIVFWKIIYIGASPQRKRVSEHTSQKKQQQELDFCLKCILKKLKTHEMSTHDILILFFSEHAYPTYIFFYFYIQPYCFRPQTVQFQYAEALPGVSP